MSKPKVLFLLGIVTLLIPFLGVPYTFKMIIAVLLGLSVCTVSMWSHIEKTNEKKIIKRPRIKKSRAIPMATSSTLGDDVMTETNSYQSNTTSEESLQEEILEQ